MRDNFTTLADLSEPELNTLIRDVQERRDRFAASRPAVAGVFASLLELLADERDRRARVLARMERDLVLSEDDEPDAEWTGDA